MAPVFVRPESDALYHAVEVAREPQDRAAPRRGGLLVCVMLLFLSSCFSSRARFPFFPSARVKIRPRIRCGSSWRCAIAEIPRTLTLSEPTEGQQTRKVAAKRMRILAPRFGHRSTTRKPDEPANVTELVQASCCWLRGLFNLWTKARTRIRGNLSVIEISPQSGETAVLSTRIT